MTTFHVGDCVRISESANFENFGTVYDAALGKVGTIVSFDDYGGNNTLLYDVAVDDVLEWVPCYADEIMLVKAAQP